MKKYKLNNTTYTEKELVKIAKEKERKVKPISIVTLY